MTGPILAARRGMLDTAIVGGGLSGLALASLIRTKDVDHCVFEARARLGGRALTIKEAPRLIREPSGLSKESPRLALDLGPTWFWPADNPQLVRLLQALGLGTFGQHESGRLVLAPAGMAPRRAPAQYAYATAQRIVGGVGAVVEALAARIVVERMRLGHELLSVAQREGGVVLSFRVDGAITEVAARRVVLAIPPRLLDQNVEFVPPLPAELCAALSGTPTWMAAQAKALAPFASAFWRENGDSGAALSPDPGAVLGEVFDACDSNQQAALGGFFALGPAERKARAAELPSLVQRQLAELFGPLPEGALPPRVQDWASERFTAAALDLEQPALEPKLASALVREPFWNGRLLFAGSETAARHPGHMEGALEAALRIASIIIAKSDQRAPPKTTSAPSNDPAVKVWLEQYDARVRARRAQAALVYRDFVQRALAAQDSEGLTQRALLEAAASAYRAALAELSSAPFLQCEIEPHTLGAYVQSALAPLAGFHEELLASAMKSNQTSCAMRNFAEEARPDSAYLHVIRADLQSVLDEFKRQVERKLRPAVVAPSPDDRTSATR
ncbi:MAG TPA: FAD-dependent oxidoreductase [Polyangiaceae bacterium]|nr:FAD-dependent oxidoreductase [Polyangiaceae bacterium]